MLDRQHVDWNGPPHWVLELLQYWGGTISGLFGVGVDPQTLGRRSSWSCLILYFETTIFSTMAGLFQIPYHIFRYFKCFSFHCVRNEGHILLPASLWQSPPSTARDSNGFEDRGRYEEAIAVFEAKHKEAATTGGGFPRETHTKRCGTAMFSLRTYCPFRWCSLWWCLTWRKWSIYDKDDKKGDYPHCLVIKISHGLVEGNIRKTPLFVPWNKWGEPCKFPLGEESES